MDMKFNYGRTAAAAIIGVMAMAIGQPASAAEVTIDFKNEPNAKDGFTTANTRAQNTVIRHFEPTSTPKYSVVVAKGQPQKSGGVVGGLGSYGASDDCGGSNGCTGGVIITFAKPLTATWSRPKGTVPGNWSKSVKFTILNPNSGDNGRTYKVMINSDKNKSREHTVAKFDSLEVEISESDFGTRIWKIAITDITSSDNFYIDNLKFDDLSGVASKLVEFRAFIPGDNAPTAPNVFCIALPEATSDGSVAAATVFRGSTQSVTSATRRGMVVVGDNRPHDPEAKSYRAFQSVALVLNADSNPGGYIAKSDTNIAADMELFAEDALSGNVINDVAMKDMDGGDCSEFHETRKLSAGRMKVNVSRPAAGKNSVSATFTGSVDTPFDISRSGKGAMDWNLTLTIDEDNNSWELTGAHDGFPAYEIYFDEKMVYESNPGDGPDTTYTFGQDVRKLQGTMDVRVNELGTLG